MAVIVLGQMPVDFSSVKNTFTNVWRLTKDFGVWLGHSVTQLSTKGWETGKVGLQKFAELLLLIWRGCLPYIMKVAAILASKPGIFAIGLLTSILILRMALQDNSLTDNTRRIALGVTALTISFFVGAYAVTPPALF